MRQNDAHDFAGFCCRRLLLKTVMAGETGLFVVVAGSPHACAGILSGLGDLVLCVCAGCRWATLQWAAISSRSWRSWRRSTSLCPSPRPATSSRACRTSRCPQQPAPRPQNQLMPPPPRPQNQLMPLKTAQLPLPRPARRAPSATTSSPTAWRSRSCRAVDTASTATASRRGLSRYVRTHTSSCKFCPSESGVLMHIARKLLRCSPQDQQGRRRLECYCC